MSQDGNSVSRGVYSNRAGPLKASGNKRNMMHMTHMPESKRSRPEHGRTSQIQLKNRAADDELFNRKQNELSELNGLKMSLITKMQKEEFKLHILSKEYEDLKVKAAKLDESIESVKQDRKNMHLEYENEYKVEKQRSLLNHEGRVNDLKESITGQIDNIITTNGQLKATERAQLVQKCEDTAQEIKNQKQSLNKALIKLKENHGKNLHNLESTMHENIDALMQTISTIKQSKADKTAKMAQLSQQLQSLNHSHARLKDTLNVLVSKSGEKQREIEVLESSVATKQAQITDTESSWEIKAARIEYVERESHRMESQKMHQEAVRRVLHNKLQELKGNIRVFCRIRPAGTDKGPLAKIQLSSDELNDEASQDLVLTRQESASANSNQVYRFQFDKIFSETSSNSEIFEELSQLIQSSLDGFNVCVFAYGQTGSGKTYTMSNSGNGIIPLSINKVFDDIQELGQIGWTYEVYGQFIEIYNDTIIDLLAAPGSETKHEIKHDDVACKTTVTNTTSVRLKSVEQSFQVLERAGKNRSTAFTQSNERSSRSHSIFIIRLSGVNSSTGATCDGTLNLIDLAGSERLSSSQAKGDRLRETQAINKSLSSLGDVIYALGHQQSQAATQHIPYRNSKLTYLLKHSLGGNSKTLMFVNISPLEVNFNETVNSLRFATKVNTTKLQ